MSDEIDEVKETNDVEEMHRLMELEAQEKAAKATPEPEPEPEQVQAPEPQVQSAPAVETTETPAAPTTAQVTPSADDPMEWAKKKGLTSPEEVARSLRKLEDEFHKRNQQGHPGYQDIPGIQEPPPPNWNPQPQMPPQGYQAPGYGYPPPQPSRGDVSKRLAEKYGMDADDVERLMPMVVDAAEAIANRRTSQLERELKEVRRQTNQSDEIMRLSQDPAFLDKRVQGEIHKVLAANPQLFTRSGTYSIAYREAVTNLFRAQLQQGTTPETTNQNNPPVTAGGGNGSANTAPFRITDAIVASWTMEQQDAYFKSNGRIVPKR